MTGPGTEVHPRAPFPAQPNPSALVEDLLAHQEAGPIRGGRPGLLTDCTRHQGTTCGQEGEPIGSGRQTESQQGKGHTAQGTDSLSSTFLGPRVQTGLGEQAGSPHLS